MALSCWFPLPSGVSSIPNFTFTFMALGIGVKVRGYPRLMIKREQFFSNLYFFSLCVSFSPTRSTVFPQLSPSSKPSFLFFFLLDKAYVKRQLREYVRIHTVAYLSDRPSIRHPYEDVLFCIRHTSACGSSKEDCGRLLPLMLFIITFLHTTRVQTKTWPGWGTLWQARETRVSVHRQALQYYVWNFKLFVCKGKVFSVKTGNVLEMVRIFPNYFAGIKNLRFFQCVCILL